MKEKQLHTFQGKKAKNHKIYVCVIMHVNIHTIHTLLILLLLHTVGTARYIIKLHTTARADRKSERAPLAIPPERNQPIIKCMYTCT